MSGDSPAFEVLGSEIEARPAMPTEPAIAVERLPFWRRLIALLIDSFVLGAICGLAGIFAGGLLSSFGAWGRIVGGVIGACYFGVGASSLVHGQTLGKRAMKIAVVRRSGGYLSLPRAFGRSTLLMLPITCNGLALGLTSKAIPMLASVVVFGLGGSILYLFIFNRRTRQSLHDLAVDTIVVHNSRRAEPIAETIWRPHFAVLAGVMVLAAVGATVAGMKLRASFDFASLEKAQKEIAILGHSQNVQIMYGSTSSARVSTTWVRATVMTYSSPRDRQRLANSIAAIILRDVPSARSRSGIVITVITGYDVIFASYSNSETWSDNPAEWEKRAVTPEV